MSLTPREAEVVALRARVDDLARENAELRAALKPPSSYPAEWGLRPIHARVLYALERSAGTTVPTETLILSGWGPDAEATVVDARVAIHRIRRRLAGLGVVIRTSWGSGFELDRLSLPILTAHRGQAAGVAA